MLNELYTRLQQRYHTASNYPPIPPKLPDRLRGLPAINQAACLGATCRACLEACPFDALTHSADGLKLDMGKCLFCDACAQACPQGAITFTSEHRLARQERKALLLNGLPQPRPEANADAIRRLFKRSLKLRQVSAGGCNACEADTNVLNTLVWDLSRFGIQFVASPRHADGLLITGPITRNMELALRKTYDAVPEPKIVIVVGACAIAGGPYAGHQETHSGIGNLLPVDLYIPGCPPHPLTILDGMLWLLGRGV